MDKLKIALTFFILSVVLTGCGSSNGLKSISIDQAAATAAPKFVASGSFTNGKVISGLPVSWTEAGPGIDATGATEILTLGGPFLPSLCYQRG